MGSWSSGNCHKISLENIPKTFFRVRLSREVHWQFDGEQQDCGLWCLKGRDLKRLAAVTGGGLQWKLETITGTGSSLPHGPSCVLMEAVD